jgi:hypothetical protein
MSRRASSWVLSSCLSSSWVVACSGDDGAADPSTTGSDPDTSAGTNPTAETSAGDSGTSTDATTTAADSSTGDPVVMIEPGAVCPLDGRIGLVEIWSADGVGSVRGTIYDRPDPWIGPAELQNASCAFHRFSTTSCGPCDGDDVCSFEGECVAPRLAHTDAVLDVTIDGDTVSLAADPITGALFGDVDGEADVVLRLRFGDVDLELPALAYAPAPEGLTVVGEGDATTPVSVDASWTPRDDGSRVRTVIPINHHAGGPTFTACDVPTNTGNLHADAGMLVPLATITGLEFQGLDVSQTAAAHIDAGCVEFRIGRQVHDGVTWP